MRASAERKQETRQRIVEAAGRLFRQHGIDAVGVDAVMHAAGLTHGGFYAHFASKEALVAEVAAAALADSADGWEKTSQTKDKAIALARIVRTYLDPAHIAGPGQGCMLPALGADVARRGEARTAITVELRRMVEALERCLPGKAPARAKAVLACLVGTVVLARLADDKALATAFLDAAMNEILGSSDFTAANSDG